MIIMKYEIGVCSVITINREVVEKLLIDNSITSARDLANLGCSFTMCKRLFEGMTETSDFAFLVSLSRALKVEPEKILK